MIAASQSIGAAPFSQNISNTKHNLSNQRSGSGVNGGAAFAASGVGANAGTPMGVGTIYTSGTGTSGSDQICVFCHTPHGSNTGVTSVPLWNRAIGVSGGGGVAGYKAYSMVGAGSTGVAAVGGMSLACLSCHDGTQAMDTLFNAPGFGPGTGNGLSASAQGYTWATGAPSDVVNGALKVLPFNLTTDLSNTHPIGMFYCGGMTTGTCNDTTLQFYPATAGPAGKPNSATVGVFKLFSPDGVVGNSTVECGTCHDPHISDPNTASFLRVPPGASSICKACHAI